MDREPSGSPAVAGLIDKGGPDGSRSILPAFLNSWALSALIVALAIAQQAAGHLNGDDSWFILFAERVVNGAKAYVDISDPNPPAGFLVYMPAVLLARATGLSAEFWTVVETFVFTFAALALSGRAPLALANDDLTKTVAEKTGFSRSRVRKAVELTTPRISGANVPTILTVTATDRGQKASVTIANEYAQAVLAAASAAYDDTRTVYEDNARRADQEVRELRAQLTRFRTQLAASSPAQFPAIEASISNAMAQLDAARREASDQAVLLSKAEQIEAPQLLTQAEDGVSAHPRTRRLMTVILAGLIGFAVGLLATFVWRGSPATRAAHGEG